MSHNKNFYEDYNCDDDFFELFSDYEDDPWWDLEDMWYDLSAEEEAEKEETSCFNDWCAVND